MATTAAPAFQAGGLISGLDTNTIITQLTALESQPLTDLQNQETGYKTQISAVGAIASQLTALASAATSLGNTGVLGVTANTSSAAFTATPTYGAIAGDYAIQVSSLATAARTKSSAFSNTDTVRGGTLDLSVFGTDYNITMTDGGSLQSVADSINNSGAPVSAVVLNDGNGSNYLTVTNRNTGFATVPSLAITETSTGSLGKALNLGANIVDAKNAQLNVNGIDLTRQTNTFSDAVPGTTLTLKGTTALNTADSLSLANDTSATAANLQKFVDAYNGVMKLVQSNLSPAPSTDRGSTLAGDSSIRLLEGSLGNLTSAIVPGIPGIRTLADLGIKTAQDGSLSIDTTTLTNALATNPLAANQIFSNVATGIAAQTSALVDRYTNPADGMLTTRTQGLNSTIKDMDQQAANLQLHIDSFRANLSAQFTAMEQLIAGYKSAGSYLTSQSATTTGG